MCFSQQGGTITVTLRIGTPGNMASSADLTCTAATGSSCSATGSDAVPAGGFVDLVRQRREQCCRRRLDRARLQLMLRSRVRPARALAVQRKISLCPRTLVTSRANPRVKQLRAAFGETHSSRGGLVAIEGEHLLAGGAAQRPGRSRRSSSASAAARPLASPQRRADGTQRGGLRQRRRHAVTRKGLPRCWSRRSGAWKTLCPPSTAQRQRAAAADCRGRCRIPATWAR